MGISAQGRVALRIGETIAVALPKGTVPFSSNENWDSPPLTRHLFPRRSLAATLRKVFHRGANVPRSAYLPGCTSTMPRSMYWPPSVWWQWIATRCLPGLRTRPPANGHRLVFVGEARDPGGQLAVDVDLGVFVVVQVELQVVVVALGDGDLAAEPDVGRVPDGLDDRRPACPRVPKPPGPCFQAESSKSGREPALGRASRSCSATWSCAGLTTSIGLRRRGQRRPGAVGLGLVARRPTSSTPSVL